MKRFNSDAAYLFNCFIAVICMGIIAILVCSCTTTERQSNADAYIKLLESTIDTMDDNMLDDAISGTDEYNAYYSK